jgi:integrase
LHQLEKTLRAFHEELSGEPSEQRSLRAFTEEWLREKEASISTGTLKFYKGVTSKLIRYFGSRAEQAIRGITRNDLIEFRGQLSKEISPASVNHDMIAVKALFAAAHAANRIAENPARGIKPVRSEPNDAPRRGFYIGELQLLLAECDPEWASMVKVGFLTGARLIDVALLKWSDVDFERGELRYTARKTSRSIMIPITTGLRDHLMTLAGSDNASEYLHPRASASIAKRGSSATLSAQFGELVLQAGLRPAKRPRDKGTRRHCFAELSYHSLRHGFVSFLKDAGAAQSVAMELAGHSSIATSQLYTHADRSSMERALSSLPTL